MLIPALFLTTLRDVWPWAGVMRAHGKSADVREGDSLGANHAQVRRARIEAAEVRAMAEAHAHNDPSFAADLRAAADRHEEQAIGAAA